MVNRLAKALRLQEEIKELQSRKNFLPRAEIEMIGEKSEAKIEEAKVLQKLVAEYERKKGFIKRKEVFMLDQSLTLFRSELDGE